MPSPIHETISSSLTTEIAVMARTLPSATEERILVSRNEDCYDFEGPWKVSKKIPDLAIQIENNFGQPEYKWILEIGFSQSQDSLRDIVETWLKGVPTVSIVVTVNIIEEPSYRCPVSNNENLEELGMPTDTGDVLITEMIMQGDYGPVIYKGRTWVGQVCHVFWKTWICQPGGKVEQQGHRKELLPPANPQVQINLGEFLTIPQGHGGIVHLDMQRFRPALQKAIKRQALWRYKAMLSHRANKE